MVLVASRAARIAGPLPVTKIVSVQLPRSPEAERFLKRYRSGLLSLKADLVVSSVPDEAGHQPGRRANSNTAPYAPKPTARTRAGVRNERSGSPSIVLNIHGL